MKASVGIIVIGRNEGNRLKRALRALPNDIPSILYVDSGSTDGSIEFARSIDISVHILDREAPFSAARARKEGVEVLLKNFPSIDLIQFVDGDCELVVGWLDKAIEYFHQHGEVGIVCGRLQETAPERSIYNRINSIRWRNTSVGDIDACGGIFMIRRMVYESAGGFLAGLLTGEEAALCSEVRKTGHRIVRLKEIMAYHDTNFCGFPDWWHRAVWGGYGDSIQYDLFEGKVPRALRHETRSVYIWAVCAPIIALLGLFGAIKSLWFLALPVFCILSYGALVFKIGYELLRQGEGGGDAILYAFFCVLQKIPYAIGFYRYKYNFGSCSKRPDPHQ